MTTTPPAGTVVLATRNAKKLTELRRVLAAEGIEVLGLDDVADYPEPAETESTFEGNAVLKARACVAATGLPALADDSGLTVPALGGMPGVRSARWAGPGSTDAENLALVLRQLADVPNDRRGARFECVLALALPDGRTEVAHGAVEGRLTMWARGENGFGYDPIFLPDGHDRTTAEMAPEEKDAISHRGRAIRAMAPLLIAAMRGTAR
ncbi:RdgB/HAM1 family non-canonical purine NTP pyrophosphatase [Granulicoccus sp. GXG6511]|uniref:RdgB/HAM1 family non-canonical purine NTP pyrophosphatase n=1 Tax=Granulicoccus sp. GXG6511 TaxID=3381351 RepID=UPI003D7DBC36